MYACIYDIVFQYFIVTLTKYKPAYPVGKCILDSEFRYVR